MQNRDFKGVWIPKEIWLDNELSWMEKLFIVEINSLDNEQGCFASNSYLGDFFNLSNGRVSQIIKSLIEKKYLSAEYEMEGKEVKRRILRVLNTGIKESKTGIKEFKTGIKNSKGGYLENDKENNIVFNNTINNTKNKKIYDEIVEFYNSTCKDLPKVVKITVQRKKRIDRVLKEISEDDLRLIFTKVHASDFLSGRSGDWRASFDWIFENDKNFVKILEGNYDNKIQKPKYENVIC